MKTINKRIILLDISELSDTILDSIGIYKIVNITTNKFYIGSSRRTFRERFKEHSAYYTQYLLNTSRRIHNPILWKAFNKYGINNFKVEILEVMNNKTPQEILLREEYYIHTLKPEYNICKFPTKSGSPNKGRKLSESWKNNIKEKSKLYKHDISSLEKVTNNNKLNAVRLKFITIDKELEFNSWVEASVYFNTSSSNLQNCYMRTKKYKDYKIIKLSKQSKSIKVFVGDNELIFNSYSECDKHFNMWRGYTSTIVNNKIKKFIIDKFHYELI